MKRFYEFEVIIPAVVFGHVSHDSIVDILRWFDVKFECKGCTVCEYEFLVTASSRDVANNVREFLGSLRSVVLASSFSAMDKMRCKGWIFGNMREVESDEID